MASWQPATDSMARSVQGCNPGVRLATNGSAGAAKTIDLSAYSGRYVHLYARTEACNWAVCPANNTTVVVATAASIADHTAGELPEGQTDAFVVDPQKPFLHVISASTSAGEVHIHLR